MATGALERKTGMTMIAASAEHLHDLPALYQAARRPKPPKASRRR
jgi:hypothetical protein